MKIIRLSVVMIMFSFFLIIISCKKNDNEFGVEDTFNLDSIIVSPSTNIDQAFEIGWAVTVTGFPTYFLKLYLSNDDKLDTLNDLKITETGSADFSTVLNQVDETQFYYLSGITGSNQVTIFHNEKTSDPNAAGWQQSAPFANPSGTTKYIIGYFYNIKGLQIKFGRQLMAVPITFK